MGCPKVYKRALCRQTSSQILTQFQLALLGSAARGWAHKARVGGAVYPPVVLDSFSQLGSIHRRPLINRLVCDDRFSEICNTFIWTSCTLTIHQYRSFPHVSTPSLPTAYIRLTWHRVLTQLPFSKCHWGITNDRNPTKIYWIDIDYLIYIMYKN